VGLAATVGEAAEAGAGAVAVVAVLAPVLAGTAAAIFLLVGYILRMLDPGQAFAQTMLTTGWVFGGVAAVAVLVAGVGLLLTALRNRPSAESGRYGELDGEVARAREAWHDALLERGILPFLREALTDPNGEPDAAPGLRPSGVHEPRRRPGGVAPELLEPGLQQPGLRWPGTPTGIATGRGGHVTECPPGRRQ
jgi:hypothetical protein